MVSAVRASMVGRKKGGPTIVVPSGFYEMIVIDPANAAIEVMFETNGTTSVTPGSSPSSASNWGQPSAIGANYDISFDGGGSWANLGTRQGVGASRGSIGTNTSGPHDVRIRDATTLVALASGSITVAATVDG